MKILITTAEKEIYRAKACSLVGSTTNGELKIYQGHAPLLAILRPGIVRIDCLPDCHCPDIKHEHIVVLGGFMEIQPDAITILADAVERSEQLDITQASQAVQHAKDHFHHASPANSHQALIALEIAIARFTVVKSANKFIK
ncbi:MAG: ATP synthase F1 subunit epsilon [Mariprofundaceae bacterium]|nr:ATP synthase F1 subunit epsilon [Mariprofundaceae bacterium]